MNLRTGKPEPGRGYAPATIAHALAVVAGFYDFHLHYGRGPLVNPVPQGSARRKALAHRSPLEPPAGHRRARLRPKIPQRTVRSIPDGLFDELFGCMRNDRDRALLAFYVSSGARASELLGLGMEDIDWPGKRIWVQGLRLRQAAPVAPDAFIYLARYLDTAGRRLPELRSGEHCEARAGRSPPQEDGQVRRHSRNDGVRDHPGRPGTRSAAALRGAEQAPAGRTGHQPWARPVRGP